MLLSCFGAGISSYGTGVSMALVLGSPWHWCWGLHGIGAWCLCGINAGVSMALVVESSYGAGVSMVLVPGSAWHWCWDLVMGLKSSRCWCWGLHGIGAGVSVVLVLAFGYGAGFLGHGCWEPTTTQGTFQCRCVLRFGHGAGARDKLWESARCGDWSPSHYGVAIGSSHGDEVPMVWAVGIQLNGWSPWSVDAGV